MKKILFIVPEFPSVSQTFILNQITSLIDLGYNVMIYSQGKDNTSVHRKIYDYALEQKVIYAEFPSNYVKRLLLLCKTLILSRNKRAVLASVNPFKYGMQALKLTNFCKVQKLALLNCDFDVVHVHFGQMLENALLLKDTGLVKTKKIVLTFHGYDLQSKYIKENRLLYHRILDDKIKITVNTPYLKSIFYRTFPNYNDIQILPVGVDTNYFKPSDIMRPNTNINILFCGRLIDVKGIFRLRKIFEMVFERSNKNVVFHIIGDGAQDVREKLLNSLESWIQLQRVIYYGSQSQEKIINIMNQSDIFILPGIYVDGRAETQGLVIQEAQAMQLPVVVTDAGGMKYGLIDGETGFFVNYTSDKEFAERVILLINNYELRKKMGFKGRDFVRSNYDDRILVRKLVNIYNSFID